MISGGGSGGGGGGLTQGTAAAKPVNPTPGQLYFTTDNFELWLGNAAGNAWQSLGMTSATYFATNTVLFAGNGNFSYQASRDNTSGYINLNTNTLVQGNVNAGVAGGGFRAKEGANCKQGISAAMVTGTVTVANTSVTATSRIVLTRQDGGTNAGAVYVSARIAGTSFTIASTNAADTGTVAYEIFEPG
jgi:hypothetical protein